MAKTVELEIVVRVVAEVPDNYVDSDGMVDEDKISNFVSCESDSAGRLVVRIGNGRGFRPDADTVELEFAGELKE